MATADALAVEGIAGLRATLAFIRSALASPASGLENSDAEAQRPERRRARSPGEWSEKWVQQSSMPFRFRDGRPEAERGVQPASKSVQAGTLSGPAACAASADAVSDSRLLHLPPVKKFAQKLALAVLPAASVLASRRTPGPERSKLA